MKTTYTGGFTFLELIVGIAIIGLMSVVIVQTFVTTSRSNTKTEILKEVKQNGDFAIGSMERIIRNGRNVTSDCSGNSAKSISIIASEGQEVTFGCDDSNGYPQIASMSAETQYITSQNIQIIGSECNNASISFTCTSYDYQPPNIEIQFSLSQIGSSESNFDKASISFQTSVNMRN